MNTDKVDDRMIVTFDFGTTASGLVAGYADQPQAPDDIQPNKVYPGANGTAEKVPSEIAYEKRTGRVHWGFDIPPEAERLRCIKLLLDRSKSLPDYVSASELEDQLKCKGKDAETAASDYLTELWKHGKQQLEERYGETMVKDTEIQFIFTVPAVWSDSAKDATRRAAQRAGIGPNLTLISEPEAAVMYTLKTMPRKTLRPGQVFICVDCGGGIVDLTAHEIVSVNPLKIRECAVGGGGKCGSVMIDLRFTDHVRGKIGPKKFDKIRSGNRARSWQTCLRNFQDNVKPFLRYKDNPARQFAIPFPGVDHETVHVSHGFFILTAGELQDLFDPVIDDVIERIQAQLTRVHKCGNSVDGILVVGGFGNSDYLFGKVKEEFGSPSVPLQYLLPQPRIEITRPLNPLTAVVRGAFMHGLEQKNMILSRKSRRHYGVKHSSTFNALLHPASSKYWDFFDEEWKADDCMTWYIKKGRDYKSNDPITMPFYINRDLGASKMHTSSLIVCDKDEAPDQYDSSFRSSTRSLCTLTADLSKVPRELWKRETNKSSLRYQSLSFTYGMQIESGGIRFDLRVNNKVYGDVVASFD